MWQGWVRRGLFAISLVCASFLVYTLVTRPAPGASPRLVVARASPGPDGGMKDFTFLQSRNGVVQWEVRAERAYIVEAEHRAVLETVTVILYGREGRELLLKGEQGTIDTQSRDFVVANRDRPLTVEFEGGYTVYTTRLGWADARREVYTDEAVTIVGQGMDVTGQGLIARLDSNEFQVQHDVRVQIVP